MVLPIQNYYPKKFILNLFDKIRIRLEPSRIVVEETFQVRNNTFTASHYITLTIGSIIIETQQRRMRFFPLLQIAKLIPARSEA